MAGLWSVFFLLGLGAEVVEWAWLAGPVASLLSPVIVGALADNRFAGQKVLAWSGVMSAVLLTAAFLGLERGAPAALFVGLLFASSVVAAPMWSSLASIAMAHLRDGDREFPVVRLGGTVGWVAAGFSISWVLKADSSLLSGYAAALLRLVAGFASFRLPHTAPPGRSRSLRSLMGVDAFKLLRERDHAVFFGTTVLLAIPLAAFYMWTPVHLVDLDDPKPAWSMSWGQFSEIGAMLLMTAMMTRFRVKTLLVLALGLSAVRYGFFAWAAASGHLLGLWVGISIHGMCYTFYFITAQMYLNRRVPTGLRTQAQGLLALFSNGVGTLLGTVFVSRLHRTLVDQEHGGWLAFWLVLGGMILTVTLSFSFLYRGQAVPERHES
ncbi:MAG: MFS transporter [Verrucomicrobiales bacterium]